MIIGITKDKQKAKRKHHLVQSKIGRYLLNLIDKHFPEDNKFHKIFNRNNKVSYSYIPNIKSAINLRNRNFQIQFPFDKLEKGTQSWSSRICP